MAWFAAEHSCLLATQQLALAQGWHRQAWELALALNTFHRRSGRFRDWIEAWQAGLAAAEPLGRPAAERAARGHPLSARSSSVRSRRFAVCTSRRSGESKSSSSVAA
jgi:hypothetical protein